MRISFTFCFVAVVWSLAASPNEDALRTFLQAYEGGGDKEARYAAAFVDLNGDGKQEAVVYLVSNQWCGSGGCPTLVLAPEGASYKLITKVTITRPPIRVLPGVSYGWRSIAVLVAGGGIQRGYEAELRFNGKKYPTNPSVPPARRSAAKAKGEIVIPESADDIRNDKPLYP